MLCSDALVYPQVPAEESLHFIGMVMTPFLEGAVPALNKQVGFLRLLKDLCKFTRHFVRQHLNRCIFSHLAQPRR